MTRRLAWLVIVALAVVCLGLVLSVAYPVSTAEQHASKPADEQFTGESADEFAVTASTVVDGELIVGFEGVVIEDGARYQVVEGDGRPADTYRSETYQSAPDGDVYYRYETDDTERFDREIERLERNDRHELLRVDRTETDEGGTIISVDENATLDADSIAGSASVFTNSLQITAYDRIDRREDVAVYQPRSDWFEGCEGYRITDATGTVAVDPETNVIQSATVSWELTPGAETYAHYLAATRLDDASESSEIDYEFETEDVEVDTPDWVEDVRVDR